MEYGDTPTVEDFVKFKAIVENAAAIAERFKGNECSAIAALHHVASELELDDGWRQFLEWYYY